VKYPDAAAHHLQPPDLGPAGDWSEAFMTNKTLVHLDISNNSFSSFEIEAFRQGLDQNHTILGIHAGGNEGSTDALGFVNQFDHDGIGDSEDVGKHQVFTRI